jgi:hypothetical protein
MEVAEFTFGTGSGSSFFPRRDGDLIRKAKLVLVGDVRNFESRKTCAELYAAHEWHRYADEKVCR